ncbi:MAG: peptidylprolyl isomerase [Nanoarchaeota archaeon]|nr:peptidylprolyl isomerase [Nanoarchaeota archaeon]
MINKKDFVELEFTAKIKGGEIFDTNKKEDAEKLDIKEVKPLIVSVGSNMVIPGLDKALEEKEIGKQYTEEFNPEQAFGKRNPALIRMIPIKVFLEQKIYPQAGMQLSLDGMLVKVASVSGGRVLVDFNNPLSGKTVVYDYTIKKKIDDLNEKINSLQDFLFQRRFEFTTNETEKTIIFKVPGQMVQMIPLIGKNFEDILGMKITAEAIKEEKKEKTKEIKEEKTAEKINSN